jgi:PAS domain S-box-containing protein
LDEDRFTSLWNAGARVHRAITLANQLNITAEEMCRLASARAVQVTIFLYDGRDNVHSTAWFPSGVGMEAGGEPSVSLAMTDDLNQSFGRIDIYTHGNGPLDEQTRKIVGMFADSASFAIAHRRTYQATAGENDIFRQMVEIADEGIWMLDTDYNVTYVNQAQATLLGYDRREVIGRTMYDFLASTEVEVSRKIVEANLIGRLGPRELEMRRKDGSTFWAQASGAQLRDDQDRLKGYLGIIIDIADRKRTEEALHNKQAALETALDINSTIIDSAFDVVCVVDDSGRFVSVSKRALDVLGRDPDELIGQRFRDFVPPERVESGMRWSREIKDGTRPIEQVEIPLRHKDGRMIDMMVSVSWNTRHQLMFIFMRDLTEQKALEARLRQAQRMEAIGQLTGGVAHDFNNLLTVILGNAEALADRLSDDQSSRLLAEMTRTAAERGADLTNRLLAFARLQPLAPKPCDINALVARMDGLMRRVIDDDIEISLLPGSGIHRVLIDASQLEAAILNIAVNARDAMPMGGQFMIETANVRLLEGENGLPPDVKPGHFVRLKLSDTGTGMDEEALTHAFEPFYTTKPVGEGSGLGLSMVYGFVSQSGGYVTLESQLGQGTCVTLYLPVSELVAEAEAPAALPGDIQRGEDLILLVEDNDLVRSFVEGQLESFGYRVISVENGAKALEVLRGEPDISLLFTDVVMPGGINGRELAEEARKLRPRLKVLFTSGYSEDAIIHHGRLDEGVQLLAKPYKRRELADKVRAVLEAEEKV